MSASPPLQPKNAQEKAKRIAELKRIIDKFVSDWRRHNNAVPISLIENAAEKIADTYFELLDNVIKAYLPPSSFANKFKVASGSEIATMFVLPIEINHSDYNFIQRRYVNARLGIHVALNMLYQIHYTDIHSLDRGTATDKHLSKIIYNHALWLSRISTKDLYSSPTFINANFWEAYFFASTGTL